MARDIDSTLSITPAIHEGELRILDTDLAGRLGFSNPAMIRKLIGRHSESLSQMGVVSTVEITSGAKGGRPGKAYYLNKKQAIFITAKSETAEATEITIEIIEKFDAYERGSAPPVPTTFREALLLAADQQAQIEAQEKELAIVTPKAVALDRIADTSGRTNLREVGKILGIGSKRGIELVRQKGWIFRSPAGKWHAYSAKVDAGYVEAKYTTYTNTAGEEVSAQQVFVTPKGMTHLAVGLEGN